jgi:hypothetical protein
MLGVRLGVVGILAREDVKVLTQDTKIKGANLQATNQLNIDTKNLEVSSVQNKHKAKTGWFVGWCWCWNLGRCCHSDYLN